jgi:hypothetical protein
LRCHLALIAAGRGDVEFARTTSDEITTWTAPRGINVAEGFARYARVVAALGEGDYEQAYVEAVRLAPGDTAMRTLLGPWTVLDLVESAVRTGRAEQARARVAAARAADIGRISPRIALIAAGAEALVASDHEAGSKFDAALAVPDADRWPFEYARIQLAYGQWLRRTRDTATARVHLHAALGTFDRLAARPWAQRSRDELRATGLATAASSDPQPAELTAQERQIATLAATGLTNKHDRWAITMPIARLTVSPSPSASVSCAARPVRRVRSSTAARSSPACSATSIAVKLTSEVKRCGSAE